MELKRGDFDLYSALLRVLCAWCLHVFVLSEIMAVSHAKDPMEEVHETLSNDQLHTPFLPNIQ
jgi:hypothetical protein